MTSLSPSTRDQKSEKNQDSWSHYFPLEAEMFYGTICQQTFLYFPLSNREKEMGRRKELIALKHFFYSDHCRQKKLFCLNIEQCILSTGKSDVRTILTHRQ